MTPREQRRRLITRRRFLQSASLAALAAACGNGGDGAVGGSPTARPPETTPTEPSQQLSGELRILLWSHFVPSHDDWFDPFAKEWGERVGVNVTVDHINTADVVPRISSEISAGEGHDLIQHIATLSQFEPSVHPMNDLMDEAKSRFGNFLDLCDRSSYNPATGNYYSFAPAWVPDPGDYRKSLWSEVGLEAGPATWEELLEGGSRIRDEQGVQLGVGLSQEIDSNMVANALLWSYGAAIQDENEQVVLNSSEAVEAAEYMKALFDGAMTQEVFAWNAASNNQGLIAGELSYILNSISAWRTAQEENPEVAKDVFFVPALEGPRDRWAAQHVMYNWIVPQFSTNVDAAQEFLLHYTENLSKAAFESKLYDFPGFPEQVPDLEGWLDEDPFVLEGDDATKLQVLKDATEWATNLGHPGPASPAIGEINETFVLPNMLARVAQGQQSAEESVEQAASECDTIFTKWRGEGLVGGA